MTINRRANFLASTPPKYRALVGRAFEGAVSPRQAIKAKCLDCSTWDRAEITSCNVVLCPLWAFRPYQEKQR